MTTDHSGGARRDDHDARPPFEPRRDEPRYERTTVRANDEATQDVAAQRARDAEAIEKKLRVFTARNVICATLVLVSVGLFSSVPLLSAHYDKTAAANAATIATLRTDLDKAQTTHEEVQSADSSALVTEAFAAGQKVAELQNKYPDPQSDYNGIASELEKLFDVQYQGNGRMPWYTIGMSKNPHWVTEKVYEINGATATVLWTLHVEGDPHIAGFAFGTYDGTKKLFTSVKPTQTDFGASLIAGNSDDVAHTDGNAEEHLKQTIDDLKNSLPDVAEPPATTVSPEDDQAVRNAIDQEREKNRPKDGLPH